MSKLQYSLVDVFTDRAFGGNPLAVFHEASGLSTQTMQALAKELNLSESTFVLPAQEPGHAYQIRIFTPAIELPMAGHPTIGTTFILARKHLIDLVEPETAILLEEGVGPIPVTLQIQDGTYQHIRMQQPLPTFGTQFSDRETIAQMLSIDISAIDASLPIEVVSCGVPFLYVPLTSLQAIRSIRLRHDIWERKLKDTEAPQIFVFTQETELAGSTVHSRMFAPAMGVSEDSATGAASGPLGCYLVRHDRVGHARTVEIVSEQGIEMGRPSIIHITIEREGQQITGVYVGGQCHFMGEGFIELPD
jgi:trans-2,3-dihydro-3-hydroxyanthranilate isomerase